MVKINRKAWFVFSIVGIVVALIGMLGFIGLVPFSETASLVTLGIGIFFILEAAIFVYLEGIDLKKEFGEINKVRATLAVMDTVPDDEGYILDMTAEPDKVIVSVDPVEGADTERSAEE